MSPAELLIDTFRADMVYIITYVILPVGAVVLGSMVGLRALPWAYRKITGFFR